MSGCVKSMREDGSKPLLVSSSASPLVMRMSCSMVIAWRGSDGFRQAATGAGVASASFPWRTRMPTSALVTDLVSDQPSSGVSIPKPRA